MSNTTAPVHDVALLERVAKILRQSEDPGATLPEREAFANKAANMMARFRIERSMLEGVLDEDDVIGDYPFGPISGGTYSRVRVEIANAVARAFDCNLYWRSYGNGPKQLTIFGFKSDAELVILLGKRLLAEADSQVGEITGEPDWWGETTKTATMRARRSFYSGYAHEVGRRLREANALARAEAESEGVNVTSTDLVLVDRRKQVNDAYKSKRVRSAAPTSGGFNSSGYSAGTQAGRNANLSTSSNQVGNRKAISA
jgi:hypothetical protein